MKFVEATLQLIFLLSVLLKGSMSATNANLLQFLLSLSVHLYCSSINQICIEYMCFYSWYQRQAAYNCVFFKSHCIFLCCVWYGYSSGEICLYSAAIKNVSLYLTFKTNRLFCLSLYLLALLLMDDPCWCRWGYLVKKLLMLLTCVWRVASLLKTFFVCSINILNNIWIGIWVFESCTQNISKKGSKKNHGYDDRSMEEK